MRYREPLPIRQIGLAIELEDGRKVFVYADKVNCQRASATISSEWHDGERTGESSIRIGPLLGYNIVGSQTFAHNVGALQGIEMIEKP